MDDTVEESNVSTCLTIKAMKSSTWSSEGPSWTISLVDENTFRFSADDSDESFDQSLVIIEEHAQLLPIPILSFAVISLKDFKKKKSILGLKNLRSLYGTK